MDNKLVTKSDFHRPGGVVQLKLQSPQDLTLIPTLDAKQWVAIGAPIKGHEFDDQSLAFLDWNQDGRIRIDDIKRSVQWIMDVYKDDSPYSRNLPSLKLSEINEETAPGKKLLLAAEALISELVLENTDELNIDSLTTYKSDLEKSPFNGDGLITIECSQSEVIKQLISEIEKTQSASNNSASSGITADQITTFYKSCSDYQNWFHSGKSDTILSLGPNTPRLFTEFSKTKDKLDDWFENLQKHNFADDIEVNLPKESANEPMRTWPIASFPSNGELTLNRHASINPFWRKNLENFFEVVLPNFEIEKDDALTLNEWENIKSTFATYAKWQASEPTGTVGVLGIDRIDQILNENNSDELKRLVEIDNQHSFKLNNLFLVEKALYLQKDLFEFVNNFVSFNRFYQIGSRAIFQSGRLFLDSRSFDLCLPVSDPKTHSSLANKAGIYLIYCEIKRKESAETRYIATAVTNGDASRLTIGKQGVFYDRHGKEWDSKIMQILAHPINLRQAIVEPFRRMGEIVTNQIEKISANREKEIQGNLSKTVTDMNQAVNERNFSTTPPEKQNSSNTGNLLAGGGVAFAALATSLTFLSSTLSRINPTYFFYSICVFIFLILAPITILAVLKLRKRDLGMLLEANGWAINGHLKLTFTLGNSLTELASYPKGYSRNDPLSSGIKKGLIYLLIGVLIAFVYVFFI